MVEAAFSEGTELGEGRYVLDHRLGTGGMATVWLARDTRLQRQVAIKVPSDALSVNEKFRTRFVREARTAAAVSHPNLVPVYDYGCEGERPYLVSEFIDGDSLARLRDRGEPPATEALARALLGALGHIHSAGIVHRDVKPANVLVEPSGRIMLTDFGIAQSTDATSLTATGMVIGTQTYLAPEVRRGERAGPPADLYACGVVLGEQLSFDDRDSLHRLVAGLKALRASDRPASAEEALEMIERGSSTVTATAPVEEPTAPTQVEPPPAPFPRQPLPPARPPRGPERVFERGERRPPAPAPVPPPAETSHRARSLLLGLLAAAALAAVIVAIVLSGGGDDGGGAGKQVSATNGSGKGNGASKDEPTPTETTPSTTTPTEEPATPAPAATPSTSSETSSETGEYDPQLGDQLSTQGYLLTQDGRAAEALPMLERAVALFPPDSTELEYAYALFNYAQALRLTGNPEAAIPLLEKRLSFSDNQRSTVEAELEAARAGAGQG